ncbi:MAG: thioredoxin family protein [Pseudomonadota bacterium]
MSSLTKSIIAASAMAMSAVSAMGSTGYSHSYAAQASGPDVYVVMFRADWCAPCKVVEPRLSQALQTLHDPRIEYINIDISGGNGAYNANTVFDRGIVNQYNRWMGITGFAAIIDSDTKRTLGCLNINYDASAMTTHIRNLQAQAQRNEQTFDVTCPAPNRPV